MKKNFLILSCFFSSSVFAFNDSYSSISSKSIAQDALKGSEKILANAPYSMCELEFRPLDAEQCETISLNLPGDNSHKWTKDVSWLQGDLNYYKNIPITDVHNVVRDYKVGHEGWKVPTAKQYNTLISAGIIRLSPGERIWATNSSGNITVHTYGAGNTNQTNASLYRLVKDLPESDGNNILERRQYFISGWSNAASGAWHYANYIKEDGTRVSREYIGWYNNFKYYLPVGARNVEVFIEHGTGYRSDVHAAFFDSEFGGFCYNGHGSLVNPWISTKRVCN
ncbi:hypothetical protein UA38_13740 [Photobacterium kishitanii]|uniref:DUF1566 domain-containing protein n=1 Tax=Photobacterium kishitanii TaxID=318456 RepID=A0AAX0YUQ3_9GAMM|nr:hypothetical protein [Photobacterium kishitanii]KJG56568.1 hypothetical protein UA38_13740 [Photobacterium kishitanii]KJG61106.1 hypothetical protein UA42_12095 [Photobacterium kishitanii]KJG65267.1 hypothetical protein UA40_12545 [Photobacterium kishitanii]KJG68807.1 hypothetical protein UA41_14655 [Photobacterium kishitanii]PSX21002.1 hypothetical protein C0W70_01860 [Photobacterium kishitanii]